jgi:hypothetical protein
MVLYNSNMAPSDVMSNAAPEEVKAGMDAWTTWAEKNGDALVDLGQPLETRGHLGSEASKTDAQVAGYSIMQRDSLDAVMEALEDHPHLSVPGNTIDVLEFLPMPGMESG